MHLYNEAVLVTAVGSLPVRVSRQFEIGRKLGKTHQNVLVFCKGDPRKATRACGPVEFGDPADAAMQADGRTFDDVASRAADTPSANPLPQPLETPHNMT